MNRDRFLGLFGALLLIALGQASGFDGNRKGFVLGVGAGAAIVNSQQQLNYGGMEAKGPSENRGAFLTNFELGYAPNNRLMLLYSNTVAWFRILNVYDERVTIASGINGLGADYYLRPGSPSLFIGMTIGLAAWTAPFEEDARGLSSFGAQLRAGIEPAKHLKVMFSLMYGKPTDKEGNLKLQTESVIFGVSLNWLGY